MAQMKRMRVGSVIKSIYQLENYRVKYSNVYIGKGMCIDVIKNVVNQW